MMRKKGFTLVEIMIVVAIIGLLAAIAIPNFARARTQAQTTACIANLKQLEGAAQVYALDTGAEESTSVGESDLCTDYIRVWPRCGGTAYEAFAIEDGPVCPSDNADHVLGGGGGETETTTT